MARHSIKDVEEKIIAKLNDPARLAYLFEDVKSYEGELDALQERGEIIDGPRIWTFFSGSTFPRTDEDNAWSHNQELSMVIIAYDANYAGPEDSAAGDPADPVMHVGTRQMIMDIEKRLLSVQLFQGDQPLIPTEYSRINLSVTHASAYQMIFMTQFDYIGPIT